MIAAKDAALIDAVRWDGDDSKTLEGDAKDAATTPS